MKKINFNFDFLSPYSFFAWLRKDEFQKENFELIYRPVSMGSLFRHFEMKGPGEILPKRIYMLKQCFIYAADNNIKFVPPIFHPFNPLYALRLSTYSCAGSDQETIIDLLFKAVWQDEIDVSNPDILEEYLTSKGLNGKELMEKAFSKEAKLELKKNINEAKDKQIFGVPSFSNEEEFYWGNDTIDLALRGFKKQLPSWNKELFKQRLEL
ncbi:MAG: DsbA family protein [Bacteriovoracaceae bacterium]|jgi:2-hydroxychromene-2-carboxylate isomerase|nr:DsbA family protein [Bacteriovoracaceae bacterium]